MTISVFRNMNGVTLSGALDNNLLSLKGSVIYTIQRESSDTEVQVYSEVQRLFAGSSSNVSNTNQHPFNSNVVAKNYNVEQIDDTNHIYQMTIDYAYEDAQGTAGGGGNDLATTIEASSKVTMIDAWAALDASGASSAEPNSPQEITDATRIFKGQNPVSLVLPLVEISKKSWIQNQHIGTYINNAQTDSGKRINADDAITGDDSATFTLPANKTVYAGASATTQANGISTVQQRWIIDPLCGHARQHLIMDADGKPSPRSAVDGTIMKPRVEWIQPFEKIAP